MSTGNKPAKSETKSYKETICLPQTSFPMRGDLVKKEPARLQKWEEEGLYEQILKAREDAGAPTFLLHDGPPFANGDVHMGTALNKVLKDLVVKSKSMAGYRAPFRPGWDCHGLPIEYKVVQKAREEEPAEIRRRCEQFAREFIDIQRESFRRLGVLGEWERPYLTLDPSYEADVLRVFAKLVERGMVYQSKKPVQWSYGALTALAEAEVEYQDKVSPAIFVKFRTLSGPLAELAPGADIVIWTTTPWTLPANQAVALHPDLNYQVTTWMLDDGTNLKALLQEDLIEAFGEKTGATLVERGADRWKGRELEGTKLQHPFLEREVPVILGTFVTTEAGSGAVHIAPGHGADDYLAGREYGLEVLSPVDDGGLFTEECGLPEMVGKHVFSCNEPIIELLAERQVLLGREEYRHQYPFCWRSKTPVIFRAVEQFFISLDDLRARALSEIDRVNWLPKWGRNRIYGTVEARPDWCISRQRTWGIPLPVFFDGDGQPVLDAEIIGKLADLVEQEGSNIWFAWSESQILEALGLPKGWQRSRDTLDVWIDSGSSHVAVLEEGADSLVPADLYLEATDQHRGWFQSSLMLSVAWRDQAPYRAVMTHGFVVDQDRKKLSKSEAEKAGKPIDAAHFYNKYGADILRLWVSSVDWQNEVPFGEELFKQVGEPYRRLRNTLRILLGNLSDFDGSQAVDPSDLTLIDRWILERLYQLVVECREAYAQYDFRRVFSALNNFCATDLSAHYVDWTKDRLYCDAQDGKRRRATQTAMAQIFDALVRLLAPILAFTAEEAWEHAGREGSVHLALFPEPDERFAEQEASPVVAQLMKVREVVQVAIEQQIQAKAFKKNNEAVVHLTLTPNHPCQSWLADHDFVTEFFILSDVVLSEGGDLAATAEPTSHPMCPRCRRYEPPVNDDLLCHRCAEVLTTMTS